MEDGVHFRRVGRYGVCVEEGGAYGDGGCYVCILEALVVVVVVVVVVVQGIMLHHSRGDEKFVVRLRVAHRFDFRSDGVEGGVEGRGGGEVGFFVCFCFCFRFCSFGGVL